MYKLSRSQNKPHNNKNTIHTEPAILNTIEEDFPTDGGKKITGLKIYSKNTPCLNPPSQCLTSIDKFAEKQGRRVHLIQSNFISALFQGYLLELENHILCIKKKHS